MAGLTKTCPTEFLNLETNIEPLRLRYEKITMDRYLRLPETGSRRQLAEGVVSQRLKTRMSQSNQHLTASLLIYIPNPPTPRTTFIYHPSIHHLSSGQSKKILSIRLRRICTRLTDYDKNCKDFVNYCAHPGYAKNLS